MAKYRFNKDWSGGTYVPPSSGMPTRRVEFKKGDVIEGTFVHVEARSESDYVETQTPMGKVRIPFGGRGVDILKQESDGAGAKGVVPTKNNSLFTVKNLIIVVVIIILIFLFIKYAWPMIKGSK